MKKRKVSYTTKISFMKETKRIFIEDFSISKALMCDEIIEDLMKLKDDND